MLIAELEYEGNILRTELPKHIEDLMDDLGSIGIRTLPKDISVGKDNVKLCAYDELGQAVIEKLDDSDNLAEINKLCHLLNGMYNDSFNAKLINVSDVRGVKELIKLFGTNDPEITDKLVMNIRLEQQPKNLLPSRCVVEKTVTVPTDEFLYLRTAPDKQNPTITKYSKMMFYDSKDDTEHCLLLIDKGSGDGLLVQTEGNSSVKRARYIPSAITLYDEHRQKSAHSVKFYCPLRITYEGMEDQELPYSEAVGYYSNIQTALSEYELPEEKEQGLMYWYQGENDGVNEKVYSAKMDVEIYDGELFGVIKTMIVGELTDEEMHDFLQYITGQLADGAGEGFEQIPIYTGYRDIYVSFWSSDDYWTLIPEDIFDGTFPGTEAQSLDDGDFSM